VYLENFKTTLEGKWSGSLFTVSDAEQIHSRAKEYLYRLSKRGEIRRVGWGWYYIPEKHRDVWEFLAADKGFKVVIKQTAASLWNYDFIHRDLYRLAVENYSYKKALESFAKEMGWNFEVEYREKIPYEYRKVDDLFIETPESCIVNCISEWSFADAFATLYFRKDEIDFNKLKKIGRWKRISKTNVRVWTAIKYGCKLFNQYFTKRIFKVKATSLQEDVRELVEEAVGKVVEFA